MTYPTQQIPSNNPQNIVISDPVGMEFAPRDPGPSDNTYHPGWEWQNTVTGQFWKCKSAGVTGAVWVPFIPGGTGLVDTLTGNSGGAVGPDGLSNINVVGDGTTINIVGNPGTFTLTASLVGGGVAAQTFTTNVGGPVSPTAAGVLNLNGSISTYTIGSVANTVKVEVQGTNHALFIGQGNHVPATTIPVGTNGQVVVGATGGNPAFATLTSADNSILFTTGANSLALSVNNALVGETITGNSGGALSPTAGNWNILGSSAAAGTSPVTTSGAASTLTVNVQTAQAIAATDATKIGLAAFNSASFTVDANGFVGLVGGLAPIEEVNVQTGTSPIVPTAGAITINGATVAAGTNPVRTDGTGANTLAVEVQISQAIASTDATKIGLAAFNSASFSVDANGFVSAAGAGVISTITGNSGGAESPLAGNFNVLGTGSITVAGSANTETVQLTGMTNHAVLVGAGTATLTKLTVGTNGQVLIGSTAADPAFSTLTSSDNSILFTTGAHTLSMQVNSALVGETITGNSGGALSPTAGNWNIIGSATAAGATPVSTSGAVSTLTINVQTAQAIGSTSASNIGLAAFNSAQFTVDANGFVSTSGTGVVTTFTGNTGGPESPLAGNLNILGTGSITVAGSANTETVQLTGLTNHAVLVGAGTATVTKVGPSATSGAIFASQGAGSDPAFIVPGPIINPSGSLSNAKQPAFFGFLSANDASVTGDGTQYLLGQGNVLTITQQGSGLSTGGVFTAPIAGYYLFTATITISGVTSAMTNGGIDWYKNGTVTDASVDMNIFNISSPGGVMTMTTSIVMPMNTSDTMQVFFAVDNGAKVVTVTGTAGQSYFTGALLC